MNFQNCKSRKREIVYLAPQVFQIPKTLGEQLESFIGIKNAKGKIYYEPINEYTEWTDWSDTHTNEIRLPSIVSQMLLKRQNMKVSFLSTYDLTSIMTEIGGFWKTVGAIFSAIISITLVISLNRKLASIEPQHKQMTSYDTLFQLYHNHYDEAETNETQQ